MADYRVELCFHASDGKSYTIYTPTLESNSWNARKETSVKIDVGEEILKSLASMCISNWLNNQEGKGTLSEVASELLSVKLSIIEKGKEHTVKEWTGTEFKS